MTSSPSNMTLVECLPEVRPASGLVWLCVSPDDWTIVSIAGDPEGLLDSTPSAWLVDGYLQSQVDPRDVEQLREILKAGELKEPAVAELRMLGEDGTPVWVQFSRLPQYCPDGFIQVSLLNIDDRVMVAQNLNRAVQTMREALITTSLEIAHPTKTICDFGGLLERHLSTQNDHVGSDYALGIRDAVERLKTLDKALQIARHQVPKIKMAAGV